MASVQAKLEPPRETECPVCHEDFTQPKILPCAHLICRHCLVTWVKTQTPAQCPLCRCVIVAHGQPGGVSGEEVVDGLPTDLAMAALVDSARTLRDKHTCQACLSLPAVSICLHCGDLMCKSCATIHVRMSMLRHHTVEDLDTLTAERLAASHPTLCSAHSDETCKLYCPTHAVSICQICAAAKHRACTNISELEEKVKEARDVLSELAAMLRSGESELDKAVSELDQHLTETEKATQSALTDIDAACDRLKQALDACRQRLKLLILAAKADIATVVKDAKAILLERRGKLTSHKLLVERTKMTSRRAHLIDMSVTLKTRVSDLDLTTVISDKDKIINKATLTIDPQTLARIERELSELGHISVVAASVSAQPVVLRFHLDHGQNITLSNDRQTAERYRAKNSFGIVVLCEPVKLNTLYEVLVDQVDSTYTSGGWAFTGVLTADPTTRSCLNVRCSADLNMDYIIWSSTVQVLNSQTSSAVGKALLKAGVGVRVGVVVDAARCLHLYTNGKDQGVAARDVKQPCYAFWDLGWYWQKVTLLPASIVNK